MSATVELNGLLSELAEGGPVMETLARMNVTALSTSEMDERTALLTRFAALVALDASPQSYLVHLGLAETAGIGPDVIRAVLVELAPLVGSARHRLGHGQGTPGDRDRHQLTGPSRRPRAVSPAWPAPRGGPAPLRPPRRPRPG